MEDLPPMVSDACEILVEVVKRKDPKELKQCIEESGVDLNLPCSSLNDSILHILLAEGCYSKECTKRILDCLQVLLDAGADPNKMNALGQTPLDIALDNMVPDELVVALIDHGATIITSNGIGNRRLARKLAAKKPHAFNRMLDHAVRFSPAGKLANGRRLIELDWRYLVYSQTEGCDSGTWQETQFLNDLLGMGSSKHIILTHPLVAAFLKLKGRVYWHNFGIYYCTWIILTFILYMMFVWQVYNNGCRWENKRDASTTTPVYQDAEDTASFNENSTLITDDEGVLCKFDLQTQVIAYLVLISFVLGPFLLGARKLCTLGPRTFFSTWQSYIFFLTVVFVLLTLFPAIALEDEYRLTWQYPCAAVGMLVAAISIMAQVTPITFVVLYAEMLYKVFIRIIIATIGLSPLFLGFFYGLRILLTNEKISAFELLTMVVSDVEYEKLMDDDRGVFYDMVAYFFFSAFIIVLVIVVLNFLIGLAVSDIQELQDTARATRFCNMVRSYFVMDAVRGSSPLKSSVIVRRGTFLFEFDPVNQYDTRLAEPLRLQLLEVARSKSCCCCGDDQSQKVPRLPQPTLA